MANFTVQFPDAARAEAVAHRLIQELGVRPTNISIEPTGESPGYEALVPSGPLVTHEAAPAVAGAVKLSVFDSAVNPDPVRKMLLEAGGANIQPMSH